MGNLRVVENTYPEHPNVPHAMLDDIVHWERVPGRFNLVRDKDNEVLFTMDVRRDSMKPNGKEPVLVGIVSQVKSKGWVLALESFKERK